MTFPVLIMFVGDLNFVYTVQKLEKTVSHKFNWDKFTAFAYNATFTTFTNTSLSLNMHILTFHFFPGKVRWNNEL